MSVEDPALFHLVVGQAHHVVLVGLLDNAWDTPSDAEA